MGFFAYPYLVTFDDTMAYGTHHFLTNFKFQCATREALLFGNIVEGQKDWREELSNTLMLTSEGYTRNMNAVPVGERVVVFMSFEDASISSIRVCFRTLNGKGEPVACGYQSIVCVKRDGSGLVELPEAFTQFRDSMAEPCVNPSFQESATRGGRYAQALFTAHLQDYAVQMASAPASRGYPRIVDFAAVRTERV